MSRVPFLICDIPKDMSARNVVARNIMKSKNVININARNVVIRQLLQVEQVWTEAT